MNYTALFRSAAETVWARKFLIVLGILAILSGASGSGSALLNLDMGEGGLPQLQPLAGAFSDWGLAAPLLILIALLVLVVSLVLFVAGTVARGGLIAGVDALDRGKPTSFSLSWSDAWDKVWTLVGIALLPALAAFIGTLLGIGGAIAGESGSTLGTGTAVLSVVLTAALLILAFILALLQVFANRAAILEGMGVFEGYSRGASILWDNFGSALLIFLMQIGISLVLGLLLFVPGLILAFCFLFWPLYLVFQGFMIAFFSAVWTRAWQQWTGALPAKSALASQL